MTNTITKFTYNGDDYIVWTWDVVWPASSTDWHLAVFDWAGGKTIKDGWAVPTVPTNVSDFNNDAWYLTSSTWVSSFNGSTWAVTYTAPVTSVNSSTWAVTVNEVPSWWTNWDVLTNVSWTATWQAPSWWDVQISSQANNILTTGTKIRAWTEANYQSLWTYDNNTIYLTI